MAQLDELRAGEQDERERGGLLIAEFVRYGSEHVGLGGGELGVGAIGECHDAHALFKTNDAFGGANDLASEIATEDGGQLDAHAPRGRAIADLQIDRVHAGSAHADEHLACADQRVVYILDM